MTRYLILVILLLAMAAFVLGRAAAMRIPLAPGARLRAPAVYHGAYVAIWVGIPALILVLLWLLLRERMLELIALRGLPAAMTAGLAEAQRAQLLAEIQAVAGGHGSAEPGPEIRAAAAHFARWALIARMGMVVVTLAVMLLGASFARARLGPRFPARARTERALTGFMILCALVAVLTTLAIIVSLAAEAWAFFRLVPPAEFLFGLRWEPQIAIRDGQIVGEGHFGAVPVFLGTLMIAGIAMLVAIPIGLLTAIYLVEYAGPRFRRVAKPLLEMLAGVPTVVYGLFAVLVVAPAIQSAGAMIGVATAANSALAAGLVIGVMIIPLISSTADDALRAVPAALRDGSLALGATPAETMTRVLLPAALPGIAGGVLLGFGRAIGETMIVLMAAGSVAALTLNPLGSATTVTAQIVTLLIGDTAFDSPKTLAAFALGSVLFLATLALNMIALRVSRRYDPRAE